MYSRRGLTLVELLVVLSIISVLIALLLPAIVRIRETALRIESSNKLKEITLATQNFASQFDGKLPSVDGDREPGSDGDPSTLMRIFPFLDGTSLWDMDGKYNPMPLLRAYISPADPTGSEAFAKRFHVSSYAANAQVFSNRSRYPSVFRDGTSNTILFSEHYAYDCNGVSFITPETQGDHRASFADGGDGDLTPITHGDPPVSTTILPGMKFQVAPLRSKCASVVPQTPHPAGLLAGLADGSVRCLSPNIADTIFWGAVTPDRGEILDSEW